jgi:hypothetical protein
MSPSRAAPGGPPVDALRQIELLTGSPNALIRIRLIDDNKDRRLPASEHVGTLPSLHHHAAAANTQGYGVFFVVNRTKPQLPTLHVRQQARDADVIEVRALFADGDDKPLPERWHAEPHFILTRPNGRWHAYWLVAGVDDFRLAQIRLALHYSCDRSICNPSRIMRLAGYANMKDPARPEAYVLRERRPRPPYEPGEIVADLPELPPPPKPSQLTGEPVLPVTLCKWLSWIDPTFKDRQGDWYGLARAIVEAPLCDNRGEPLGEVDDLNFRFEILDAWCSGELWRMRTGDSGFLVPTYHGSSELADHVLGRDADV